MSPQMVNKTRGRVIFENNREALWSCADRSVGLSSCGVLYFVCLSERSYLFPGERSITPEGPEHVDVKLKCEYPRSCGSVVTGR